MKISEPLWRDSNSQLQYRDIVLHSVVHMCDFRRNSYHSGSHRGSSSSCAGAHVDEILNYLKTKVSPILGHIFPVFQLLINLGAELNHQDRATGWTCLMQVPKIIVQSLVTCFWFIWLQLQLNCYFLKNWRIRLALQATFYGHSEVVTTLLEAGADPTVR